MTINPTLGTGLFIGTGQALAVGGPASLIFAYLFLSTLIYCVTTAIAEVSSHSLARNGAMVGHTYHYVSGHLGFAVSYLRLCSLSVLVPFEVTTAMVNLGLWTPGPDIALRMGIVIAVIFAFNMLPDRVFRRSQAFFTGLKLVTTVGLIIISCYIAIRNNPKSSVKGFYYWTQPGPFNEFLVKGDLGCFLGLVYCLLCSTITVVFIPELTVQRAEQHDSEPGNSIFRAARTSNLTLFALYILSALASTVMAPYDDLSLTNNGTGAGHSPYTVGLKNSGIKVLPLIATGLIFISSVASGRSFLHLSSRMLASMAETGHAPAMFSIRNRWSVPYISVAATAGATWLTFLSMAMSSSAVHNYLMFFITTSGYLSWMCSSITYLRFRRAANLAAVMPLHRSRIQPYGAWFSLGTSILLILLNLLQIAIIPRYRFNPRNAIPGYVAVAMFISMYLSHWLMTGLRTQTPQLEAPTVEDRAEIVATRTSGQALELEMRKGKGGRSTPTASGAGSPSR
ncbi:putative proline permease [Aspergillus lucknowensis]|uniref:Amino acid permease/ SLC12A domain-containing protein n=1 Tax=Aspergillus lucknowensis TaxID=176173 RepID=A0ABR4M6W2_9EURO